MSAVDYVIKDIISDCDYRFVTYDCNAIAVYYDGNVVGVYYNYIDMLVGLILFIGVDVCVGCYDFRTQADKLGEWIKAHITCG